MDAFKDHIGRTGRPETFDRISTTMPPAEGLLVVLWEFTLDRRLRPGHMMAPCPICCPDGEKYLRGVLIWCEATRAIYAIGYECAVSLWAAGRLDKALEDYRNERDARFDENRLLDLLPSIPAQRAWIARHQDGARLVDQMRLAFRARAPGLKRALWNDSQDGLAVSLPRTQAAIDLGLPGGVEIFGQLRGREFLSPAKSHFEKDLWNAEQILVALDAGDDELAIVERVDSLSAKDRRLALRKVANCVRAIEHAFEAMTAAAEFLSEENFRLLDAWGRHSHAPRQLEATWTKLSVSIRAGDEIWATRAADVRPSVPPARP